MAEAHSAVAFSFSVTHEGFNAHFDREVLHLIWLSGLRSWNKRIYRLLNNIKCGVYPASVTNMIISVSTMNSLYYGGYDPSFGFIHFLQKYLPAGQLGEALSVSIAGLTIWSSTIFAVRNMLKLLFMYKGWIYEERGQGRKLSLFTRLWILGVKFLSGWNQPMLYSFQGSLPSLPLPSVKDTMTRYLRSVRPLMNDEEYKRMEKLTVEFQNGIGHKLQRYLFLKSWWSTNYVSDWWEEYVYLRGRSPIMVNSNFYGLDAILRKPTNNPAARAANITYSCLMFRRAIERQELAPILVQGLVPLCSWQYERVFNTNRIPGEETDRIQHLNDSTHVAVYHKGKYYRVPILYKGKTMKPPELQIIFQKILDDKDTKPEKGEEKLAALTASDRTSWAKARKEYFSKGVNRTSLDAIEKAAFVLVFDDEEYHYDQNDPSKLNHFARNMLHGKGYDRWFDKSFTICIGKNARVGFNSEHSWADAAVMSHMWEFVMSEDLLVMGADAPIVGHVWEHCIADEFALGYDANGNTVGVTNGRDLPAPIRLKWEIPNQCVEIIEYSANCALALLNDVDLEIFVHNAYGKGFIKSCRVSPDAYLQMALQLAYYRDAGKFNLTYEASMTRLFKEGRTETVRPCTIESCQWVLAMENPTATSDEKINLLRKACVRHQLGYQDAMCGKGIDRHLFCLYVISKYLEIDSPFLKEVLSEPWRLSTSQTPHGQTSRLDLNKHPDCISAGGGFGPVADDGYGVSYIIAGEDVIFFHVSSKKGSPETNSARFGLGIGKALQDIKELFEGVSSSVAHKKNAVKAEDGVSKEMNGGEKVADDTLSTIPNLNQSAKNQASSSKIGTKTNDSRTELKSSKGKRQHH